MQRINTTVKRITEHYELDKQGMPKLHTDLDSFQIVMGEFGGKLWHITGKDILASNNTKTAEYHFENGLKVAATFELNHDLKQYILTHLIFGS